MHLRAREYQVLTPPQQKKEGKKKTHKPMAIGIVP